MSGFRGRGPFSDLLEGRGRTNDATLCANSRTEDSTFSLENVVNLTLIGMFSKCR